MHVEEPAHERPSAASPAPTAAPPPAPTSVPAPRSFLARAALVILSAVLARLALPPFPVPQLALVAIVPLLLALRGLSPREGLRVGFLFGLVSAALDASWFLNVFPLPLAFGLWLILALFYGLYGAGHAAAARQGARFLWLAAPALWLSIDWFRSEGWHLRFAWFTLGHVLSGSPTFCQNADLAGVYGLTLLAFTTSWLVYRAIESDRSLVRRAFLVVLALGLALGAHARGAAILAAAPTVGAVSGPGLRVVAVQDESYHGLEPKRSLTLEAMKTGPQPDVILWPEDSFLTDPFVNPATADGIAGLASRARGAFVFGYMHSAGERSLTGVPLEWNGAMVLDPTGKRLGEYHKQQPVQMVESNVKPGHSSPVFDVAGARLGIMICYDGTYPFVTRNLVAAGATVLLIPTMDVADWGPVQHLHHALFYPLRACEVRRPIVRAATSGLSFALDSWGREIASVPPFAPGAFMATVEPRADLTPYSRGGWLLPFVALGTLGFCGVLGAVRRRSRAPVVETGPALAGGFASNVLAP